VPGTEVPGSGVSDGDMSVLLQSEEADIHPGDLHISGVHDVIAVAVDAFVPFGIAREVAKKLQNPLSQKPDNRVKKDST
jgi:hypothetical protein